MANGAVVGAVGALCGAVVGLVLVCKRPDARDCRRPSDRSPRSALGAARNRRLRRGLRGDGRRVVAGESSRPRPDYPRSVGAADQAEARTPLGDRGCCRDRGRRRQPRRRRPQQPAAARRRNRGDNPRHPAPGVRSGIRLLRPHSRPRPCSPRDWRYETSPATTPARGRRSPPSLLLSVSQRRSSSPRRRRRNWRPPRLPTSRTARSGLHRPNRGSDIHSDPDTRAARAHGRPRP